MDQQDIFNTAATVVLTLVGWLGKSLWDAVAKLKDDLKDLEIALPNDYVKKVDIGQQQRQTGAAVESFRNEMVQANLQTANLMLSMITKDNEIKVIG